MELGGLGAYCLVIFTLLLVGSIFFPFNQNAYAVIPSVIESGEIHTVTVNEIVTGTITIKAGGTLILEAGIQNKGTIINDGTIILKNGGFIVNLGIIDNICGTIIEEATSGGVIGSGVIIDSPCTITLTQTIINEGETLLVNSDTILIITGNLEVRGTLDNRGTIENRGIITFNGGTLVNIGTINNTCGNFIDRILPTNIPFAGGGVINNLICAKPTFTSTPVTTVDEDLPYLYSITSVFAAEYSLVITSDILPIWLTLTDAGDGSGSATLAGTPTMADIGDHPITLTVTDDQIRQSSATQTFTITVILVNDAPVADSQTITTDEDTAIGITLTASDVDGDKLTFLVTGPTNGVLSGTAPNLTYTPNLDYNGSDSLTFTVNDGQADSNLATVSITVTPVNDAPVAIALAISDDNEEGSLHHNDDDKKDEVNKAEDKVLKKIAKAEKAQDKADETGKEKDQDKADKELNKLCKEAQKLHDKLAEKGEHSDLIDEFLESSCDGHAV